MAIRRLILLSLVGAGLRFSGPADAVVGPVPPVHITIGTVIPRVDPDPAARREVASLPSVSGPWKATWDLDTGRVRMLYNGEIAADRGDLETNARRFIAGHGSLFGMSGTADLSRTEGVTHGIGETIRFQQRFNGLRVVPGDVAVSRNADGRIYLVSSSYRPALGLSTRPRISAPEAMIRARAAAGAGSPSSPPELIVWAKTRPFRLAWQVDVNVKLGRIDRVLVDAAGGQVLTRDNLIANADPTANVYLGNSVSTPKLSVVPLGNLDASGTLTGRFVAVNKFTAYDGQGNPTGSLDLRSSGGNFLLPATSTQFGQTMMYFHVNRMHDYYKNTFNYTKREGTLPAYVGVAGTDGKALNNAFYSPQCDCITFGMTDSGLDFSLDADVIGHEFTHSVVNTLNQITNNERWTEARAMNEALADYFSATVQGEGCMGEYMTGKTDGSCGRDLTNRKHYPEEVSQSEDLPDGSKLQDFPEEHYTGQIWGGALWDMRRSLGAAVADKIIFNSLPLYPQSATFSDARVATRTADQQLGTSAGATIAQIMDNRGIAEQAIAAYAQPGQFSPSNQQAVVTGPIGPGFFNPVGMLPVFVSGRKSGVLGLLDGFNGAKGASLFLINPNDQSKSLQFKANLADVSVPSPRGNGNVTVQRFMAVFTVPAGSEGSYNFGIGTSADGTNFNVPIVVPGAIVKDAGAVPDPPKEVVTTSQPVPTTSSPPPIPPSTPAPLQLAASIALQPQGATVPVGGQIRFTAAVTDTTGQVVPGASVTWQLDDPQGLADISPTGILSAQRAGSLSVVARIGGVQTQSTVTITAPVTPANVAAWKQMPGGERGFVLSLAGAAAGGVEGIYTAGLDSVRLSVNGGPFQDVINGLDPRTTPRAIAVNPANPAIVYLATLDFGLLRSQNGGQTWFEYAADLAVELNGFFAPYPIMASIAVDAQDEILLGTVDQGTFVKLGLQQPWLEVNTGLNNATINSALLNSTATALFAGSSQGVYRLRAGDPSWTAIDNGLTGIGFEGQNYGLPPFVNAIALNPNNDKELVAGTFSDGLFHTSDEGDTWTNSSNGLTDKSILSVAFDPLVPGRIFAGTNSGGVFVSSDSGRSWQAARAGLPIGTVPALLFDPANPRRLFAGTWGQGVWALDLTGDVVSGPGGTQTGPTPGTGDVNGDGRVNVADATLALQIAIGLILPSSAQKAGADVNGDGTVNIQDATVVLRKAVGL